MEIDKIFSRNPVYREQSIYCFGNEQDGDCFDEEDFYEWENNDLYSERSAYLLHNKISEFLVDNIVNKEEFIVDLSTGPRMGFIPAIKKKHPAVYCVASDANFKVVEKHSRSLSTFMPISFAQFSALDIPFRDNSVSAYSSFIGIASTRNGMNGYVKTLSEIYRTLKPGGRLYAIENEWTDISQIIELFKINSKQPWDCFLQEQKSWKQLFVECGFKIVYNELFEYRNLTSSDNELGEMAEQAQVDIGQKYEAFILEK